MSPDSNKPGGKSETQTSTGRKTASARPQEPVLKCPRCDSPNTKFCYYNNYSLTQPRHFCKTCRRYWTRGGALRNVPIGGGCRKNKRMKSSPRLSGDQSKDSSSDIGGLKFFQGISPAMDFQLGGINFPRLNSSPNTSLFNPFSAFGDNISNTCGAISSNSCFSLQPCAGNSPLMGFSFQGNNTTPGFQLENGSLNVHSSLASSIESLSSINQDLHWKLQQQRLAMMYVGDHNQKENTSIIPSNIIEVAAKPQPILFQNLDISKAESCGIGSHRKDDSGGGNNNLSTEWFFDNSYATVPPTPAASSGSNVNDNTSNWGTGIQAWSSHDLTQYTSLP